jgi:GNAT superfamily N-acetyltransferase
MSMPGSDLTGLDFSIRRASIRDEPDLLALADRLPDFGPTTRSAAEISVRERRALTEALSAPASGQDILVAEVTGGRIVGVLLLEQRLDYFTGVPHGHVAILAVAREAEGRGVGGALLQRAETWASERGYRRLTLNVFAENERAQRVYSRNGWNPEFLTYFKILD